MHVCTYACMYHVCMCMFSSGWSTTDCTGYHTTAPSFEGGAKKGLGRQSQARTYPPTHPPTHSRTHLAGTLSRPSPLAASQDKTSTGWADDPTSPCKSFRAAVMKDLKSVSVGRWRGACCCCVWGVPPPLTLSCLGGFGVAACRVVWKVLCSVVNVSREHSSIGRNIAI